MLQDGKPKDIYRPDNLHMTPDGYVLWTQIIRPVLEAEAARPSACQAA
jgi:lysophospholipase L1-like esterase